MLKTAEIDRFENFACAKPAGGAKAALALTLTAHALIIAGLAAIGFHLAPPIVETSEVEARFTPPPPQPVDLSLIESIAIEKPLRNENPTEFQIRELPNDPPRLQVEKVPVPDIAPEHPEFNPDFLPKPEPPPEARPPTPKPKVVNAPPKKRPAPQRTRSTPRPKPPVFSKATVRSTSRPSYPESARRKGIEGTANVRLSLNSSGRVTAAAISKSSGNAALDASALRAAKRWKFKPATSGGRPVASKIVVPISFRLN